MLHLINRTVLRFFKELFEVVINLVLPIQNEWSNIAHWHL